MSKEKNPFVNLQNVKLVAQDAEEFALLTEKLKKLDEHIRIEPDNVSLIARFNFNGEAVIIQPENPSQPTMGIKILCPVKIYRADEEEIYFCFDNFDYAIYYKTQKSK